MVSTSTILTHVALSTGLPGGLVGNDLANAVPSELRFDPRDQLVAGHGIKLDPSIQQELDLLLRRAVVSEICSPDRQAAFVEDVLSLEIKLAHIGQPQTKIDDMRIAVERIAAGIALEGPEDGEPGLIEVVVDRQRQLLATHDVDQLATSRHRYAFRAHDRDVVALRELHALK